ncbi:MAG: hypothetical protein ACP6IY_20630, partial [Promethearchaeia archaeon]
MKNDKIQISFENEMSGNNNIIYINSNLTISDVDIYLNDSLAEHYSFSPGDIYYKIPTNVFDIKGRSYGNNSDLNNVNSRGLLIKSKRTFQFPCKFSYKSFQLITFDLSSLKDSKNQELMINILAKNLFYSKIYYYNITEKNWELIFSGKINQDENINYSFNLSDKILKENSLVIGLSGNSEQYFSYLLDMCAVKYIITKTFKDEINLDVSNFQDGYYVMRIELFNDAALKVYENQSIIYVDNSAPELYVYSPKNGSIYNNTDIISFSFNVVDHSSTRTILIFFCNGSEYMTLDFSSNKEISYRDYFLPGNYSYIILTTDIHGHENYYCGEFAVQYYETPPIIISNENEISINVPKSVNYKAKSYYININVKGTANYDYLVNLTYTDNNSLIDNFIIKTNETCYYLMKIFNTSFNLNIYNINKSYNLIFNHSYIVSREPENLIYSIIMIEYPKYCKDSGYNIKIYLLTNRNNESFSYKVMNKKSGAIIADGYLENATTETIYCEI